MRRALLLLLLLSLSDSCVASESATQLLVVVDSDLPLSRQKENGLAALSVRVLRADGVGELVPAQAIALSEIPSGPVEHRLPLSFALTPQRLVEGAQLRLVLSGQNSAGEDVVERQVITAFRKGAALRLEVFLGSSCLRQLCRTDGERSNTTCDYLNGLCSALPTLIDLPAAHGDGVSDYQRPVLDASAPRADAGPTCQAGRECDDGLYCNGAEQCAPTSKGANAFGCVSGTAPSCPGQQTCDETRDMCTSCALKPDGDGDQVNAIACGGSDCNDGDPAISPGHAEICDGKDNDCDEVIDGTRAGGQACVAPAADAGVEAGVLDAGGLDADTKDVGLDGSGLDAAMDVGIKDGGSEAGAQDGGTDGGVVDGAVDSSMPLVSHCQMGSLQACSSVVSAWGTEVQLGSYGALMEANVGQGFENTVSSGDTPGNCATFLDTFGASPSATAAIANDPFDLALYTVYRPANWIAGERYPLVTWGNGTCFQVESYAPLLRGLASQGFIVVAANSRFTGSGNEQRKALDFMFAANSNVSSPYFARIDTTKVAALGHSQGSTGTINAASDARIGAVILFNGGNTASKPFLTISGDRDIGGTSVATLSTAVNAAPRAAFLYFHMVPGTGSADGQLTLLTQPERVIGVSVAWLKYLLSSDSASRSWFVGAACTLCGHESDYEYGQKGL